MCYSHMVGSMAWTNSTLCITHPLAYLRTCFDGVGIMSLLATGTSMDTTLFMMPLLTTLVVWKPLILAKQRFILLVKMTHILSMELLIYDLLSTEMQLFIHLQIRTPGLF